MQLKIGALTNTPTLRRSILCLLLVGVSLGPIDCSPHIVATRRSVDNPTNYLFKMHMVDAGPMLERHAKTFNSGKFDMEEICYHGSAKPEKWWPVAAQKALSRDSGRAKIWLRVSVDSSEIYRGKDGLPLGYLMECALSLIAVDSEHVRASITVLKAEACSGKELFPRPPHFVHEPRCKAVEPTTIEEYKILQSLGAELGIFDTMPALTSK